MEKTKFRSPSQGSEGSSIKEKSSGELRETEIKRTPTTEISSPAGQKRGLESSATAASEWAVAKALEPSLLETKAGNEELDRMCVDRLPSGPVREELEEAQMLIASTQGGPPEQMGLIIAGPQSQMLEDKCFNLMGESESHDLKREPTSMTQPGMKQTRKKWKRAAREVQKKSKAGLLASPLQRKMIANLSNMKAPNRNSPPFSPSKSSPKNYNDKGKINMRTKSPVSPQSQSNQRSPNSDRNINGGIKRRVVFESPEDVRNPKKGKVTENDSMLLISSSTAEPGSRPAENHEGLMLERAGPGEPPSRAGQLKAALGFEGGFGVSSIGSSGGLILLWKDNYKVTVLSFSAGHIDARIQEEDGLQWRFSGMYGDPDPRKRGSFWTLMRRLREVDRLPWIQAVEDCDLVDLGFSGPMFTWNNRREGKDNVQERLDRVLASNSWRDVFHQTRVEHLSFFSSDHRPLLWECKRREENDRRYEKRFQFESFWLKEDDIGRVITESWEEIGPSGTTGDLKIKLDKCAEKLMGWSKSRFGNLRKQIEEKSREIEYLYRKCRETGVMQKIKVLERSVESLIEKEEMYWRQRSRADWLSAGDRNTRFFHEKASARKKKNCISSLQDSRGGIQFSEEGMAGVISDYFTDIFSTTNPSAEVIRKVTGTIKSRLSEEMK
ncbi:hypothetical protein LWI29_022770 [Acer saccharum]|uniref:Endonuclease/exonuclease/phosphatase domain-containing protein n=1 Tax=Acer saccharum TaxID=4024 RepID=A0AA39TH22_ACESA|nr:hypothetical protein LWI29_022770 [Acer saccharum]